MDSLFLSQADNRPMYQQIVEQIKLKVVVGDWPPGFALPSIRELAASMSVSVITVKRAYTDLEGEGVIITQRGRGSFVANTDGRINEIQLAELQKKIEEMLLTAEQAGLSAEDVLEQVNLAIEKRVTTKE